MLIAQLSDLHVGGARFLPDALRAAVDEVNEAAPDLVVVAGDLTDEGYPDQQEAAARALAPIRCERVVRVPGNHDAKHVGVRRTREALGGDPSECSRPWVWPQAGILLVHSGTACTMRARGFRHPAYNMIEVDRERVRVELRVPGGDRRELGTFPRAWPPELARSGVDLLDPSGRAR